MEMNIEEFMENVKGLNPIIVEEMVKSSDNLIMASRGIVTAYKLLKEGKTEELELLLKSGSECLMHYANNMTFAEYEKAMNNKNNTSIN